MESLRDDVVLARRPLLTALKPAAAKPTAAGIAKSLILVPEGGLG